MPAETQNQLAKPLPGLCGDSPENLSRKAICLALWRESVLCTFTPEKRRFIFAPLSDNLSLTLRYGSAQRLGEKIESQVSRAEHIVNTGLLTLGISFW